MVYDILNMFSSLLVRKKYGFWMRIMLHIQIDTPEVYGLHAFIVKGTAHALSIYFRPMSLLIQSSIPEGYKEWERMI